MTIILQDTLNPINRDERNKINENWQRIVTGLTKIQLQINTLAGGTEVDELLNRITEATSLAEITTSEMNILVNQVEDKLSEMQEATDDSTEVYGQLVLLKGELEQLHDEMIASVNEENIRRNNEIIRQNNETQRTNAELTREANEQTRNQQELNRQNTFITLTNEVNDVTDSLNTLNSTITLQESNRVQAESNRTTTFNNQIQLTTDKLNEIELLISNLESFEYNSTELYDFPNLITFNGSTYIALKPVQNVTPTNDKINYRLIAQRGVDGNGAVNSVNGVLPDLNGNVDITFTTPLATTSQDGLMSKTDKTKLNGISNGANFVAVEDSLNSTSPTDGLSAKQGNVLKVELDNLANTFYDWHDDVYEPNQMEIDEHLKNATPQAHIEVVTSIPSNLSESGILFKVEGTVSIIIPSPSTVGL